MSNLTLSLLCLFLSTLFINFSFADVGTAAQYGPPFIPTKCFGGDASKFPPSNMIGAAGEGIWDNGAACGRRYKVRCLSAVVPKTCIPDQNIEITIVDRAQSSISRPSSERATMVLSTNAFKAIANASVSLINIEYQEEV